MNKLLIIEDEKDFINIYTELFSNKFDLKIVGDGSTGWKEIQTFAPQAVILDLVLPGEVSGIDILRDAKAASEYSSIPFFVVSISDYLGSMCKELGAYKFYFKLNTNIEEIAKDVFEYFEGPGQPTAKPE